LSGQNTHHAPITFNLACNFICDGNDSQYERISIKWKSDIRDDFRRSHISMLPKMNSITDCADFRNRSEINNYIEQFTTITNDVAELLLHKTLCFI
jgi:hypothetical protein